MSLLSVSEARARMLAAVSPVAAERLPLHRCNKRVLYDDVSALVTQPRFDMSAMDGYGVRAEDGIVGSELTVIGEAAAGHMFAGTVGAGEAVRIFTGAVVPEGVTSVLIQENATRLSETSVRVDETVEKNKHIRSAGLDFHAGDILQKRGHVLDFRALSLAASMNHATLNVFQKPKVAVIATGDELVEPGQKIQDGQVIASNAYGLAALIEDAGGEPIVLNHAKDDIAAIQGRYHEAVQMNADIIVTIGGASVGEHDLIVPALQGVGFELNFWKIAMRPGKPLLFGKAGNLPVLGLPGNPVSSLVCGLQFLKPLLHHMTGRDGTPKPEKAKWGHEFKENGPREHYVRAKLDDDGYAHALPLQDSAVLSAFYAADCLVVCPPHMKAVEAGAPCSIMRF